MLRRYGGVGGKHAVGGKRVEVHLVPLCVVRVRTSGMCPVRDVEAPPEGRADTTCSSLIVVDAGGAGDVVRSAPNSTGASGAVAGARPAPWRIRSPPPVAMRNASRPPHPPPRCPAWLTSLAARPSGGAGKGKGAKGKGFFAMMPCLGQA